MQSQRNGLCSNALLVPVSSISSLEVANTRNVILHKVFKILLIVATYMNNYIQINRSRPVIIIITI
jgi:hypothetical protein